MTPTDEAAIQQLMSELPDAWNRGDAKAYGARYRADGTSTKCQWFYVGREEFERRHEEAFQRVYKGTMLALTIKHR
jgi:uncharacterized protein (TIGR02246 family)